MCGAPRSEEFSHMRLNDGGEDAFSDLTLYLLSYGRNIFDIGIPWNDWNFLPVGQIIP